MPGTSLRRLIEFVLLADGAQMQCSGCGAVAAVPRTDPTAEILLFQDRHFECDPHLRSAVPDQRDDGIGSTQPRE